MTTLNDFKQLRASVPAEVQTELYSLFTSDPEASFQRMVDIAAEKGVTLTVDEVKGFLKQMDEEEEFDDIELDSDCPRCHCWWAIFWSEQTPAKRKRMTSHGVVALACVPCASRTSVGSLSLRNSRPEGMEPGLERPKLRLMTTLEQFKAFNKSSATHWSLRCR